MSAATIAILTEYKRRFPGLFRKFDQLSNKRGDILLSDVYPDGNGAEELAPVKVFGKRYVLFICFLDLIPGFDF